MILQVSPDAPTWVRAAAASVLYLHIGAATLGLASGAVAILTRKGARLHRAAGNVFFGSMLVMAGIGMVVAPLLPQRIASVAGGLTFYLVATGWVTVMRRPGRSGIFEVGALAFGIGVAVAGLWLGWIAASSPRGTLEGLPYQPAFVFAALALLGVAYDFAVIRSGGVIGPARVTRHLWRMCVALLIATVSFVGQPKAIPEALRGSPLLFVPIVAVLALTLFWLVRVRFTKAFRAVVHA